MRQCVPAFLILLFKTHSISGSVVPNLEHALSSQSLNDVLREAATSQGKESSYVLEDLLTGLDTILLSEKSLGYPSFDVTPKLTVPIGGRNVTLAFDYPDFRQFNKITVLEPANGTFINVTFPDLRREINERTTAQLDSLITWRYLEESSHIQKDFNQTIDYFLSNKATGNSTSSGKEEEDEFDHGSPDEPNKVLPRSVGNLTLNISATPLKRIVGLALYVVYVKILNVVVMGPERPFWGTLFVMAYIATGCILFILGRGHRIDLVPQNSLISAMIDYLDDVGRLPLAVLHWVVLGIFGILSRQMTLNELVQDARMEWIGHHLQNFAHDEPEIDFLRVNLQSRWLDASLADLYRAAILLLPRMWRAMLRTPPEVLAALTVVFQRFGAFLNAAQSAIRDIPGQAQADLNVVFARFVDFSHAIPAAIRALPGQHHASLASFFENFVGFVHAMRPRHAPMEVQEFLNAAAQDLSPFPSEAQGIAPHIPDREDPDASTAGTLIGTIFQVISRWVRRSFVGF